MQVRRLTTTGIAEFEAYLKQLKAEPTLAPPVHLLTEENSSESIAPSTEIEPREFTSRFAAAEYLHGIVTALGLSQAERDAGLWTWLTLFYFDQLCPAKKGGKRKIGEIARYVPQIGKSSRYYRHLMLGPFAMYCAHADDPQRLLALLSNPVEVATSETYRLFIENPTLIGCPAVVATATNLYFDRHKNKLKRGAGSKDAGGCRRLVAFLQQIDLTFDLPLLTELRLVQLLPQEFDRFMPKQTEIQL